MKFAKSKTPKGAAMTVTGRIPSKPAVQNVPVSLPAHGSAQDILARLDLLWSKHPELVLPYKYGVELLEWDSQHRIALPDDAQDVYTWPWRKVQQYCVRMLGGRDPGDNDSMVIRANLAGQCKGEKYERDMRDAKWKEEHDRLVAKWEGKPLPEKTATVRFRIKPRSSSHGEQAVQGEKARPEVAGTDDWF